MKRLTLLLIMLCGTLAAMGQSCPDFDESVAFPYTGPDAARQTIGHIKGNHRWYASQAGSCVYDGDIVRGCNTYANASSTGSGTDWGGYWDIKPLPGYHAYTVDTVQGHASAFATTDVVSADTAAAVSWVWCPIPGCSPSVTISGSGEGGGFQFGFPSLNIGANDKIYYKISCGSVEISNCSNAPTGSSNETPLPEKSVCISSPLVVDTKGQGFEFTDPNQLCVMFDIGDGKPKCYSWPKPGGGVGFLVRRTSDGKIHIFGNYTPQPDPPVFNPPIVKNGFTALMQFDVKHRGYIDATDKNIWPDLFVLIDKHCYKEPGIPCVFNPEDLHKPEEFGIFSVATTYSIDHRPPDKYGNQFRYSSQTNSEPQAPQSHKTGYTEKLVYDVYLVSK